MKENFTYGLMRRGWYPQPFTLLIYSSERLQAQFINRFPLLIINSV